MKQLVLISVMCLSTMFAKAQVMTSETISNVYSSIAAEDKDKFAYNGEYDDNGRITEMTVYKKKSSRNGQEGLKPYCQYQYEYTSDGLLNARTKYVWRKNQWQCFGRHEYMLKRGYYVASYSRWNKKASGFDAPVEKIVYTLLPDNSISQISYYHCKRNHDTLQLAWQMPVLNSSYYKDVFLTQK